jgi:hypothetical protein
MEPGTKKLRLRRETPLTASRRRVAAAPRAVAQRSRNPRASRSPPEIRYFPIPASSFLRAFALTPVFHVPVSAFRVPRSAFELSSAASVPSFPPFCVQCSAFDVRCFPKRLPVHPLLPLLPPVKSPQIRGPNRHRNLLWRNAKKTIPTYSTLFHGDTINVLPRISPAEQNSNLPATCRKCSGTQAPQIPQNPTLTLATHLSMIVARRTTVALTQPIVFQRQSRSVAASRGWGRNHDCRSLRMALSPLTRTRLRLCESLRLRVKIRARKLKKFAELLFCVLYVRLRLPQSATCLGIANAPDFTTE